LKNMEYASYELSFFTSSFMWLSRLRAVNSYHSKIMEIPAVGIRIHVLLTVVAGR